MSAVDLGTIAGRLRFERMRLGHSREVFAALAGVSKGSVANWEKYGAFPNAASLLAFANAGADVLFIVTGRREGGDLAGKTVRQALALLDASDRHRLLLDLLAEELRA